MANTSYKIRGIEPSDLAQYPPATRKMYWQWIVELGIKQKVRDLQAGLDRFGKALRPIAPLTRKYRRSAMTPSGKGDPSAPPLIPAHMKSRTISLLDGRAFSSHAEFFWRFDAWTGNEWGVILAYQREHGRDVIGISPASVAKIKTAALRRWNQWKAGRYQAVAPRASTSPAIPTVGRYDTTHATFGIGVNGAEKFARGQWTGAMTRPEWDAYFRQSARASIPGRPNPRQAPHPEVGPNYNRLLAHVWGQPGAAGQSGQAIPPRPIAKPSGPSRTKVAMGSPATPIAFNSYGKISKADKAAIQAVIGALPVPALKTIKAKGIICALTDTFSDWDPVIGGQQPPGWPAGATWDHSDGAYFWKKKILVLCQRRKDMTTGQLVPSGRLPGVARHETGHAFDDAIDGSLHAAFLAAYNAEAAALAAPDRATLAYYLQAGKNGPREVFAECFGQLHGGGSTLVPIPTFFPACAALVRGWARKGRIP